MSSYKAKMMIVMRRDLKMRKGKIAAQAGHACTEVILSALLKQGRLKQVIPGPGGMVHLKDENRNHCALSDWFSEGVAKVCVYVDGERALLDIANEGRRRGYVVSLIKDAGITEFHGKPTYTCLAFEPLYPEDIDPITGDLPLY